MSRHNHLQHVADALSGSFNSRNNDVDGHWGLGLLCAFAGSHDQNSVMIDLMEHRITPVTERFNALIDTYQEMLYSLLEKQNMPVAWAKSVIISAQFNVPFNADYHQHYPKGEPALVSCEIIDEHGKKYAAQHGCYCAAHDPLNEFN